MMEDTDIKSKNIQKPVLLQVAPNGPLYVKGDVELIDQHGRQQSITGFTAICRCGGSHKRPFCDGTHNFNGFTD